MTRIVAGAAGSLTLAVPPSGTRPTSDRVREAVFSALDARDAVRGARVLDLYAGSGALGLEAASRGAASVELVEKSRAAAEICRRNARAVAKAAPNATVNVRTTSVLAYLSAASPATAGAAAEASFDLVFADPPYDVGEGELAGMLAALLPRLASDAAVLVERSSRSPEPTWPPGLQLERRRGYGETVIWTARPVRPE